MPEDKPYQGRERRRHRVYVTRNTEYHLRDGVCVAVRDRQTKSWMGTHDALNQAMLGSVRVEANGAVLPSSSAPRLGDALFFDQEILTSALCAIERPAKDVVETYPS